MKAYTYIKTPPEKLVRGEEYVLTHVGYSFKEESLVDVPPSYSDKNMKAYKRWCEWQVDVPPLTYRKEYIKRGFYLGPVDLNAFEAHHSDAPHKCHFHQFSQEREVSELKRKRFDPRDNIFIAALNDFTDSSGRILARREWTAWKFTSKYPGSASGKA